jgi:RimJ/RimL family protein N-acetyltransferase
VTRVRGAAVTLRPIREEEFAVLWAARSGPESFARPWTGDPQEEERALRRRIAGSGEFTGAEILFGMDVEGRLIGEVQARQPRHGLPPGVFELGIEIFEAADRGRGHGAEAVELITSHLFEEQGAIRVQASTDVDNGPMRRLLDRLGFGFEGVLRGFMPTSEGPRDYAMYAMTENDWTTKTRT